MKPSRAWWIWGSLALCAVFVFGAMTWFTRSVLAGEREVALASARADQQENMRLALWRMDSLGASILLDESLRQIGVDSSRLPVKTRFEITNGQLIAAPGQLPELEQKLPPVSQRKIVIPPAPAIAPVVPSELKKKATGKRSSPASDYQPKDQAVASANELDNRTRAVKETLERANQAPTLSGTPTDKPGSWAPAKVKAKGSDAAEAPESRRLIDEADALRKADAAVAGGARLEEGSAGQADGKMSAVAEAQVMDEESSSKLAKSAQAIEGPQAGQPRISWANGELFVIRPIFSLEGKRFEGAWINLEGLRNLLLAEASDLLPEASLVPATATTADGMVLASFPLRLQLGRGQVLDNSLGFDIRQSTITSLAIGWMAALLAMATAALLIRGVMRLSERRASFVSAVTHELRTPLTTFRLYSDMLETGAVKEEKRGQYLRVLSREADRLAHLVENVLAFSRIERGSARSMIATTTAAQLLEPMRERFEARLAAPGLTLEMDLTTPAAHALLKVDSAAVEHILFNLIDNAAKYAASGTPPQVEIHLASGRNFEIRVRDHGPGIPLSERRRIFRAFHKSAHDAAESRPGVGLGLALSQRLAREMGGDLHYQPRPSGACFVLSIPNKHL